MRARLILTALALLAPASTAAAAEGDQRCPSSLPAPGYCGDDGPAARSGLDSPSGVAAAPDGAVFVGDAMNGVLRRIGPNGRIGRFSRFTESRLTALPDGSLLYTEEDVIKRVDAAGVRTIFAGGDATGFRGDGGAATGALLAGPAGLDAAAEGIYVADQGNHRVRLIRSDGTITTVAGNGRRTGAPAERALESAIDNPVDVAANPVGGFVVATLRGRILRVEADGRIAQVAQVSSQPSVEALPSGEVVVFNREPRRLVAIASDGATRVLASGGECAMADSQRSRTRAGLVTVADLDTAPGGALLIADYDAHRVLRLDGSELTVVAGGGLRAAAPAGRCRQSRPSVVYEDERPTEYVERTDDGVMGFSDDSSRGRGLGCERTNSPRFGVAIRLVSPRRPKAGRAFEVVVDVGRFATVRVAGAGRSSSVGRGAPVRVRFARGLRRGRHRITAVADAAGQRLCASTTITVN